MIYTTFAQLYDKLMDSNMYDSWVRYFDNQNISTDNNILDLACGTGRFAIEIAKKGYNVTGFDLSENMLSLAEGHALDENVNLQLIVGDMCDLSGIEKYDIITCFADSLCYLPDESKIELAFKEIRKHLKKDGMLFFDVITPYKTDIVYPGYMYNYDDETQAFLWTTYAGEHPHSVEHELTFFIFDEESKSYKRLSELHKERTYSIETYKYILKIAGFTDIEISADFGLKQPCEKTERWFFKCR